MDIEESLNMFESTHIKDISIDELEKRIEEAITLQNKKNVAPSYSCNPYALLVLTDFKYGIPKILFSLENEEETSYFNDTFERVLRRINLDQRKNSVE